MKIIMIVLVIFVVIFYKYCKKIDLFKLNKSYINK